MKRKNIMVLMIALSLVLLLGSSYALLRSTQIGTNPYVINVGTLQVTFEDNQTQILSLENMYPMSDKEGMSQSKELGFVVKNTGNVEARYNVYLEETSTAPEFKNHIRFISNKNDQGYNEPKTMGYDKYIDLEARLGVQMSASYKVKVWLDSESGNEYMDKTFTSKVVVESNQIDTSDTLYAKINNEITKHPNTTIVEDNITYLSGNNEDVNYNYVWYSGKLWRIVSINSDGTIKMITDDIITAITFGKDIYYENSWIREWLNEDFKDTLYNYQNIIVTNYSWNNTLSEDYKEKIPETDMVKASVGMLTAYEYYQSYKNSGSNEKGYLNILHYWWLITPYSNSNMSDVDLYGNIVSYDPYERAYGVRPSINLKPDVRSTGEGSKENPYQIIGDKAIGTTGELLNTRNSGEYVKVDNKVYRIVGIENKSVKLVSFDYASDNNSILHKQMGSTTSWTDSVASKNNDYWGYYLNNTWLTDDLRQYITEGTYYFGQMKYNNSNYKLAICENNEENLKRTTLECIKTTNTWRGLVGILRLGEMFSAQFEKDNSLSDDYYLINPSIESNIAVHTYGGLMETAPSTKNAVHLSINLKPEVIITGEDGMTPETAYTIALP